MSLWDFSTTLEEDLLGENSSLGKEGEEKGQQCVSPSQKSLDGHQQNPSAMLTGKSSKQSHNAYERDQRKKLSGLYSSLHSMLPEAEQRTKPSMPYTVSRTLEYIPKLQRDINELKQKKEDILMQTSQQASTSESANQYPVVSATCIGDREIMIQICSLCTTTSHCSISNVLECLEREGLHLSHASTSAIGDSRESYHLHLQDRPCQSFISTDVVCLQTKSVTCQQTDEADNSFENGAEVRKYLEKIVAKTIVFGLQSYQTDKY